jgi:hypothetical protein
MISLHWPNRCARLLCYVGKTAGAGGRSLLVIAAWLSLTACQQADPGPSRTTSAIEVVQAAIEKELDMAVSLKVETFRQNDEWAFLAGLPLTADGNRIDYSQTKFADDVREGYFDDGFVALTRRARKGVDDWSLVALSLGATDAPFVGWPEEFGVPKALVMP